MNLESACVCEAPVKTFKTNPKPSHLPALAAETAAPPAHFGVGRAGSRSQPCVEPSAAPPAPPAPSAAEPAGLAAQP